MASNAADINGRVVYIDPTNISFFNENGGTPDYTLSNEMINNNMEDYCLALDLEVIIPERESCGMALENGTYKTVTYTTANGTISFLAGTNGVLTTNYTDINPLEPSNDTAECLGIESISIQYDSWIYPMVDIKFVDVRGGSVMMPEEESYFNKGNTMGSVYRALFSFPYPLFKLKVKGFYGKGVTYYLTPYDSQIEFDASSGNYNISVKFIGSMFRIYTDMPMSFVCLAPFMENGGQEYWQENVASGVFSFTNADGTQTPMITFSELKERVHKASEYLSKYSAAQKSEQLSIDTDNRAQHLQYIMNACPANSNDWYLDEKGGTYIFTIADIKEIKNNVKAFFDELEDDSGDKEYAELIAPLKHFSDKSNKFEEFRFNRTTQTIEGETTARANALSLIPIKGNYEWNDIEGKNKYDSLMAIRSRFMSANDGQGCFSVYYTTANIKKMMQAYNDKIKAEIDRLRADERDRKERYRQEELMEITKALGFTPSIKNIYDLVFAHMDTFVHTFFDCTKQIREQLENNSDDRKLGNNSAVEFYTDLGTGVELLPPYPGLFQSKTEDGQQRNVNVWPEDWPGGENLLEVDYVKGVLAAAKKYTSEMQEAEERNNSGGDSEPLEMVGDAPTVSIDEFIPVTTYDFMNRGVNPYAWLSSQNARNLYGSPAEMSDAIIGTFGLRLMYYLITHSDGNRVAETFGEVEAINFAKAVGDEYADPNFLKFIREIKDTHPFWTTPSKRFNEPNHKAWNNRPLWDLIYEKHYLPMGGKTLEEVKKDVYVGGLNAVSDSKYYLPSNKGLADETFKIFNSRDYLKGLRQSMMDIEGDESFTIANKTMSKRDIKRIFADIDFEVDKEDFKGVREQTFVTAEIVEKKNERIVKTTPVHRTKVLDEIINGDYANRGNYFVNYPSSIYGQPIYDAQSNLLSRACLFLYDVDIDGKASGLLEKNENGVAMRALLLREGAFYWRQSGIGSSSGDPISSKYYGPDEREINAEKLPEDACRIYSNGKGNHGAKEPIGCTPSRRTVLMNEFIKWAKTEYGPMEPLLMNPKFYKVPDKKSENQQWELDLSLAIDNLAHDHDDAVKIQEFLRSTYLDVATIFDAGNGYAPYEKGTDNQGNVKKNKNKSRGADNEFNPNAFSSDLEKGITAFIRVLKEIYEPVTKKTDDEVVEEVAAKRAEDPFRNKDLRLATYNTLKMLYEKWLCAPYKGEHTWSFGKNFPDSDFNTFKYMDSYYHDIGRVLPVNISKIEMWIDACLPATQAATENNALKFKGRSVYEFLADIAQNCGGMLLAFPIKIGQTSTADMVDMFRAMPYNSDWETDSSTFLFLYSYEPSKYLAMNNDHQNDGFDFDTRQTMFSDSGYTVPAFAVSYAKQNQSYFKDIKLNTESAGVTEASIASTIAIAGKGSEGARETNLFGQDLYRVKTSYAYTCEFDMMGCAQVMPMMYFQLNNVPFWRGAYIIYKVSHQITAGEMTTHVMGVRVNKNALPMVDGLIATDIEGDGSGGSAGGNPTDYGADTYTPDTVTVDGKIAMETQWAGDSAATFKGTIDFDENNIAVDKPLICITPAHGPETAKGSEWFWSRKLVDQYIIPKLKKLRFHDGTSYAKNIHRCNTDTMGGYEVSDVKSGIKAEYTSSDGYSTREVQQLIKKYGSNKVISIIPHWNGGAGQYFAAFDGGYKDHTEFKTRKDSLAFATLFREEAEKACGRAKGGAYPEMPDGFMKSVNQTHVLSPKNSDGGPILDCACVLTENFFADYGKLIAGPLSNIPNKQNVWSEKNGTKFVSGQGWLLSDEGLNAISDIHVEAIRRYIENLHAGKYSDLYTTAYSSAPYTGNGSDGVTAEELNACAQELGVDVPSLLAIKDVESGRYGAFIQEGKPPILFEGHIFWSELKKVGKNPADYAKRGNIDIIYPSWTKKYYKGGLGEYERLDRAKKIDEEAALKSASWGMFQILGLNYSACGYGSVRDYVNAMCESAGNQLMALCKFIKSNSAMLNALRSHNWAEFAKRYNGPGYKENQYDTKLAEAYKKHSTVPA